jgi:hypothetical protein
MVLSVTNIRLWRLRKYERDRRRALDPIYDEIEQEALPPSSGRYCERLLRRGPHHVVLSGDFTNLGAGNEEEVEMEIL